MALSLPIGWDKTSDFRIKLYIEEFRYNLIDEAAIGPTFSSLLNSEVSKDTEATIKEDIHRFSARKAYRNKLFVKPWACIKDVKDQLQRLFHIPSNQQRLFFLGKECKNTHSLQDYGIVRDGETMVLQITSSSSCFLKQKTPCLKIYGTIGFPKSLVRILHHIQKGLDMGYAPQLAMDGTGGTYFFRGIKNRLYGCFKPRDEEPFAPYNPKGFVGTLGQTGFRKGILSGEACEREVAAFFLDKDHFADVPATGLVEAFHPVFNYNHLNGGLKLGSLQEFVRHDDVASDLSPDLFHIEEVHKLAVLDIRLVNTDRNDANILVQKRKCSLNGSDSNNYHLVPIDHGYCLPDVIEVRTQMIKCQRSGSDFKKIAAQIGWCDWCWFNWPQLKEPIPDHVKGYIRAMRPEEDAEFLRKHLSFREDCIRNMLICSFLLQQGVALGLSLHQIASVICRTDLDKPSHLEKICTQAEQDVLATKCGRAPKESMKIKDLEVVANDFPRSPLAKTTSPLGFWATMHPYDYNESGFVDENSWEELRSNESTIHSHKLPKAARRSEFDDYNHHYLEIVKQLIVKELSEVARDSHNVAPK